MEPRLEAKCSPWEEETPRRVLHCKYRFVNANEIQGAGVPACFFSQMHPDSGAMSDVSLPLECQ